MWDHLSERHKEVYKSRKASQVEFAAKKKEDDQALAAKQSLCWVPLTPKILGYYDTPMYQYTVI